MEKQNIQSRRIISLLLSFFIALFFGSATYLVAGYFGFFNESVIYDSLNSSDYYPKALEYYSNSTKTLTVLYGVDDSVLQDTTNSVKFKIDVDNCIHTSFYGKKCIIDTESMESKISANMTAFMVAEDITLTTEVQTGIDEFTKMTLDNYAKSVNIPYFSFYVGVKNKADRLILAGTLGLVLIGGFLISLILGMYKRKLKALRYIIYSTITTGLLCIIVPVYLLWSRFYERVQITPDYVSQLISSLIFRGLWLFVWLGFGWLILSAILLYLKQIWMHQNEKHLESKQS